MTPEEQREQIIQNISGMLQRTPFTFEFKVKKNPKGIQIIYEVTQEEMDAMVKQAAEKEKSEK